MPDNAGTALVTGASGFVGSHLVERLVGDGVHVRALLRGSSSEKWLPASPLLHVIRASFDDDPALRAVLHGVDQVYHLAAVTSAPNREVYFRANSEATRKLLKAMASTAPDAKFILCSTLAAAGPSRQGRPMNESDPCNPITAYGESKREAELTALESALDTTVVRPPTVYGPRDRDIFEMFRWASRGLAPMVGSNDQKLSIIHVADLVNGLVAAAHSAKGSVYFVTDGKIHTRGELLQSISRGVRRSVTSVPVPAALALPYAHVSRIVAGLAGWKPLLTPDRIRDFMEPGWTCDDSRARAELNYRSDVDIESGMASTAQWYRDNRWL
jgi:nucleoside-diphosphate-sugar epimerase